MHPTNDHKDLKVGPSECDGSLNLKNYLDWVKPIKRIFELKEYNEEKSFKLAILKMKGMPLLGVKVGLDEEPELKIVRFIKGLSPNIAIV